MKITKIVLALVVMINAMFFLTEDTWAAVSPPTFTSPTRDITYDPFTQIVPETFTFKVTGAPAGGHYNWYNSKHTQIDYLIQY